MRLRHRTSRGDILPYYIYRFSLSESSDHTLTFHIGQEAQAPNFLKCLLFNCSQSSASPDKTNNALKLARPTQRSFFEDPRLTSFTRACNLKYRLVYSYLYSPSLSIWISSQPALTAPTPLWQKIYVHQQTGIKFI